MARVNPDDWRRMREAVRSTERARGKDVLPRDAVTVGTFLRWAVVTGDAIDDLPLDGLPTVAKLYPAKLTAQDPTTRLWTDDTDILLESPNSNVLVEGDKYLSTPARRLGPDGLSIFHPVDAADSCSVTSVSGVCLVDGTLTVEYTVRRGCEVLDVYCVTNPTDCCFVSDCAACPDPPGIPKSIPFTACVLGYTVSGTATVTDTTPGVPTAWIFSGENIDRPFGILTGISVLGDIRCDVAGGEYNYILHIGWVVYVDGVPVASKSYFVGSSEPQGYVPDPLDCDGPCYFVYHVPAYIPVVDPPSLMITFGTDCPECESSSGGSPCDDCPETYTLTVAGMGAAFADLNGTWTLTATGSGCEWQSGASGARWIVDLDSGGLVGLGGTGNQMNYILDDGILGVSPGFDCCVDLDATFDNATPSATPPADCPATLTLVSGGCA